MSQVPNRPPVTPPLQSLPEQLRELGKTTTNGPAPQAQPVPVPQAAQQQQSELLKRILNDPGELVEVARQIEGWQPGGDGRRVVEAVIRECGYALPRAQRGDPLWLWIQRMVMAQWTYYPAWMARPVSGNLFLLHGDGNPCHVGVILKGPEGDRGTILRLIGSNENRQVELASVEGYLVPPDGCKTCVQRSGLLRRE